MTDYFITLHIEGEQDTTDGIADEYLKINPK